MSTYLKKNIFILILLSLLIVPAVSYAAPWKLVPDCGTGGCNVCDAIGVGINITKIMLGTLGSAALLVFVYGGFLMLISRGHSDQVQKGKDALINAVKGVIIVLASWMVINYGLAIMLGQDTSKTATIFNGQWATVACGNSGGFEINGPCNRKSAGQECGSNLVCSIQGNCVTKNCKSVYNDTYSCQETSIRSNGTVGCEAELCGGSPTMMCCPK